MVSRSNDGKSLVRQRFHRGSAERVAVGRLERSFRDTGDGSLWQPDDECAARTRALGSVNAAEVAPVSFGRSGQDMGTHTAKLSHGRVVRL